MWESLFADIRFSPIDCKAANKKMPYKKIESSEQIYQLALSNDEDCIKMLEEVGEIIGIGLTNLIHVINPEVVILGGGVSKAGKFIMPSIQKTIKERGLSKEARETRIVTSKLGDDAPPWSCSSFAV